MSNNNINVKVRMYRSGHIGDCFLLMFCEGTEVKSRMLIDCGALGNTKAPLINIVDHIQNDLGTDGKLDVIVGTHQHQDHLSGFVFAKDKFEAMAAKGQIGEVWLSWLDKPGDKQAGEIQGQIGKVRAGMHAALYGMTQMSRAAKPQFVSVKAESKFNDVFSDLKELLAFEDLGEESITTQENGQSFGVNVLGATDIPKTPQNAMNWLNSRDSVKYLEPGTITEIPGMEGKIKVYVLGPPRDLSAIKDMDPDSTESYDRHLAVMNRLSAVSSKTEQLASGILTRFASGTDNYYKPGPDERQFPFNRSKYGVSVEEASHRSGQKVKASKAGAQNKSASNPNALAAYYDPNESWRQIEYDWLEELNGLALFLNKFINNSSLALAIEIVETGQVLLFPADAQTGNWQSWDNIDWQDSTMTTDKLLRNTVLYKVGHHGSHNATLKPALEKMTHQDLVAMIPTNEAEGKKLDWIMPAVNLAKRLEEVTQNRILRADLNGFHPGSNIAANWEKVGKPTITDLYVEYTVNSGIDPMVDATTAMSKSRKKA